jgi:Tol biopolymer transport system component
LKLGLSDVQVRSAAAEQPDAPAQPATIPSGAGRRGVLWLVFAVAGVTVLFAALAVLVFSRRQLPLPERVIRFEVYPAKQAVDSAISPDGRYLVFSAVNDAGKTSLWIHSFDAFGQQEMQGTEGAASPFWAPDSRSVGFFAEGKLKRMDISSSAPRTLCDAPAGHGGAWSHSGTIIFAANRNGMLSRVSAEGGLPKPVDGPRPISVESSYFLPDGTHFLYSAASPNSQLDGVFAGSVDSKEVRRLGAGKSGAYANRSLLFLQADVLMEQPFDPIRMEFAGEARRIRFAEHVRSFSISQSGTLVYQEAKQTDTPLVFLDRQGRMIQNIDEARGSSGFSLSPDGKTIALSKAGDIWLLDLSRGLTSRLTFAQAGDAFPVWSPGAKMIVFHSTRGGARGLYQKVINGDMEQLILNTQNTRVASIDDWSPDGRFITYSAGDENGKSKLWAVQLFGDRKPFNVPSSFDMRQGRFSPDGRWLAYVSDESGSDEVYVQAFPGGEGKWQVSTHGGVNPLWRRDGRELNYISPDNKLMAVPVATSGSSLQLGTPVILLNTGRRGTYNVAIAPDGRFLMPWREEGEPIVPMKVVVNWAGEE